MKTLKWELGVSQRVPGSRELEGPNVERPAYRRAVALIEALNEQNAPCIVHGLLQAVLIAEANDIDAAAERHRGGGHQ
jgi:hypothetical protein